MKVTRLTGLGALNYRNVGLGFSIGVLIEMRKELDEKCRQALNIQKAEEALKVVLQNLPDDLTEEQIEISTQIFMEMEKYILKLGVVEYKGLLSGLDRENLYEMLSEEIPNCGTDYI